MEFEVYEIFKEPEVALNVCESPLQAVFSMTPKSLYSELKKLAEARYGFTSFPKKMTSIKCLENSANKFALLRDICNSTGITMNFKSGGHHEFILENDVAKLRAQLSEFIHQAKGPKKAKKEEDPVIPDEQLFTYANLPFHETDFADFFPLMKYLKVQNKDASAMMQQARQAQAEGHLE